MIETDREGLIVYYGAIRMIRYVSLMLLDMLLTMTGYVRLATNCYNYITKSLLHTLYYLSNNYIVNNTNKNYRILEINKNNYKII